VRDVSIKAVGIGVAANIVATLVTLAVAVFVGAVVAIAEAGGTPAPVSDNSAIWIYVILLIVPGVVSGYAAAQVAPSRKLLHGALSALLVPLFVLYTHLGGPVPQLPGHDIGLPWYLDDYFIAGLPPLCGVAGAHVRALVTPKVLARWTAAVLAVIAIYMMVAGLCFALSHAMFSYSLGAMVAIIAGHFAAPPQHRRAALFALAGLLGGIFVLLCAGYALSGSQFASASMVIAANVASGCFLAVMTMRRHYKTKPPDANAG
jgi:hypothetical protein